MTMVMASRATGCPTDGHGCSAKALVHRFIGSRIATVSGFLSAWTDCGPSTHTHRSRISAYMKPTLTQVGPMRVCLPRLNGRWLRHLMTRMRATSWMGLALCGPARRIRALCSAMSGNGQAAPIAHIPAFARPTAQSASIMASS